MKNLMKTMMICGALALGACGEVDEAIDCIQICDEVQDCTTADIDVTACRDTCEDANMNDVDRCEECLTNMDECGTRMCDSVCDGIAVAPAD